GRGGGRPPAAALRRQRRARAGPPRRALEGVLHGGRTAVAVSGELAVSGGLAVAGGLAGAADGGSAARRAVWEVAPDRLRSAAAAVHRLRVERGIHFAPVRHHSPACA